MNYYTKLLRTLAVLMLTSAPIVALSNICLNVSRKSLSLLITSQPDHLLTNFETESSGTVRPVVLVSFVGVPKANISRYVCWTAIAKTSKRLSTNQACAADYRRNYHKKKFFHLFPYLAQLISNTG